MEDHDSYNTTLTEAILSSVKNMNGNYNFESSFDMTVFHLKNVLTNADSDEQKRIVQQIAQELFSAHVWLIEQRFTDMRDKQTESTRDTIRRIFSTGPNVPLVNLAMSFSMPTCIAIMAIEPAIKSLGLYFENIFVNLQGGAKKNNFFYQVARAYTKLALSEIYGRNYDLVDKIIERNKNEIFDSIYELNKWEEGIELLAILKCRKIFNTTQIENDFFEKYRRSLVMRLKTIRRFFIYVYVLLPFSLLFVGSISYAISPALLFITCPADLWVLNYYWRYGPEVSKLKSLLAERVKVLCHTIQPHN